MKDGKLEIVVERDGDFDEWIKGLEAQIREVMNPAGLSSISTRRRDRPSDPPDANLFTLAALSAASVVSIFIASIATRGCPASTWSPSRTRTLSTLPGIGAVTPPLRGHATAAATASAGLKANDAGPTDTGIESLTRAMKTGSRRPSITSTQPPSSIRLMTQLE